MNLDRFVVFELAELADVPERRDHQMAGRIGILVQEHERALAAVDDEPLLVRGGSGEAEHASLLLVGLVDVFEPPRRPELLRHRAGAYAAGRRRLVACKT